MKKEKMLYLLIGQKIRELRKSRGSTQSGLAAQVQLSRTSITNIEKGRQSLLVHTLHDLAQALGTSIDQLMPQAALPECEEGAGELPRHLSEGEAAWVKQVLQSGPDDPLS